MEDVPPSSDLAFPLLDPTSPETAARIGPFWGQAWKLGELSWMVHSGQYVMGPDHHPLIGRTPIDGLWVNTGYSGHSIMCSPAGGSYSGRDLVMSRLEYSRFALDRVFVKGSLDQILGRGS